jgi:uncharacterized protein with HEPN domain
LRRDDVLLLDIALAAGDAIAYTNGMTKDGFHASRLHQSAVIRCLEIVGEAASKLSREFRTAHADIPWQRIVGMRHKLIHDYGAVDLDQVWIVVRTQLPSLIDALKPLIPPDTGERTE